MPEPVQELVAGGETVVNVNGQEVAFEEFQVSADISTQTITLNTHWDPVAKVSRPEERATSAMTKFTCKGTVDSKNDVLGQFVGSPGFLVEDFIVTQGLYDAKSYPRALLKTFSVDTKAAGFNTYNISGVLMGTPVAVVAP